VKTEIKINLNEKGSLGKGLRKLRAYRRRVENNTRLLVQKLTDCGAEIVRVKIGDLGAY
jgi:hypothetical protein